MNKTGICHFLIEEKELAERKEKALEKASEQASATESPSVTPETSPMNSVDRKDVWFMSEESPASFAVLQGEIPSSY